MHAPLFVFLALASPSAASGGAGAWYRRGLAEASESSTLDGAGGSGSEDGNELQDEVSRLLEEEGRMHNELDDHEESLQKLIRLSEDQDAQTDDISRQLSRTSAEKRELAARLESMEGELSSLREKNEIAKRARRQNEGLDSRGGLPLGTAVARAGADLQRRLEEEERETEALEGRVAGSRRARAIRESLGGFYARKARIVEEAKEYQDHEAELTRELARSLRNLGTEPGSGMRQEPAGGRALTRHHYAQYHALAASIPELARELRAKQEGVFENLQGMEDGLRELVRATQ